MRLGLFVLLFLVGTTRIFGQVNEEKVKEFVTSYVARHPLEASELEGILSKAEYQSSIIEKMERPAEGTMTWGRYRNIFLQPDRIDAGVAFWQSNQRVLEEVSQDSGVPVEIILGILGVETFFGQRIGTYRVLDALYTLAFGYPKRASFFKAELEKFLELVETENLDIYEIKGSYAGAIGYSQFMPSSYLAYAKSYDDDASRNLMEPNDAIASVANYLAQHRWTSDAPVVASATREEGQSELEYNKLKPHKSLRFYNEKGFKPTGNLSPSLNATLLELEGESGLEYWFGFNNFYVITRYNHSVLYAMAVVQLSEAIKTSYEKKP